MRLPLVTCYILTYLNFDNVFQTIDSVLDQDYPEIEIGIFDDGSDDFPLDCIKNYIDTKKGGNIKSVIIHKNNKNLGTVKNLNTMLRMTNGSYLIDLSSDDKLFNNQSVSRIVDYFVRSGAEILISYKRIINPKGNSIRVVPSQHSAKKILSSTALQQYKWIAMGAPISGAGLYYSREFIEKMKGFDEDYHLQEDGPLFLRATRNGHRIDFLDEITYDYMLGKGVSSGENNNPLLVEDVNLMFKNEILPYKSKFNFLEWRRVLYEMERINECKRLDFKHRILYLIKYPDVILFRLLFSH